MTRSGFEEVHSFMAALGLPAGDSFWLFDPSGGDMALFTHDAAHPGPQHAWLLDKINDGTIDVLHSAGSYGELFSRGHQPMRGQIEVALEYLAKHARVPRIWTNHGDVHNTQNIGGQAPSPHHMGDLPGASAYCLDLLLDHGVKYFWLDRLLVRDSMQPGRLTAEETCRDGRTIQTFVRYLSPGVDWSPNAQNLDAQLREPELANFSQNKQDAVLYTHWGCHHRGRSAFSPEGAVLTPESRAALVRFAATLSRLDLELARLEPLLDESMRRPLAEEIQRIGGVVVGPEKSNQDLFYFNQYHKHGFGYFQRRVDGMAVSGRRALDAGCGVGQWTYALRAHFDEAHGIELNPAALEYLGQVSGALRWTGGPFFASGSIEDLPYPDGHFDFILCYGVMFVTRIRRSFEEFRRVLAPGGRVYLCLNGDGWYEYLCDERFKDRALEDVVPFAEPIWNALVARVGGETRFDRLCRDHLDDQEEALWRDPAALRRAFLEAFSSPVVDLPALMSRYSDRVMCALGLLTQRRMSSVVRPPLSSGGGPSGLLSEGRALGMRALGLLTRRSKGWSNEALAGIVSKSSDPLLGPPNDSSCFPMSGLGAVNRAFTPSEFARLATLLDFDMNAWGPDASLAAARPVPSIYQGTFNGHDSVWECLLTRAPTQRTAEDQRQP